MSASTSTLPDRRIRVLLADGNPGGNSHLAGLISIENGMEVVSSASTTEEVLQQVLQERPDIVLLSLTVGGIDGFRILEQVYSANLNSRIICIAETEDTPQFVRAVRCGCRGILLRQATADLVMKSIRKVYEGELWLDRLTTAQVLQQFTQELPNASRPHEREQKSTPLSPREREIVGLVTQGYKNKELAEKLLISEQTVKNHMHNIFDKLGVSDRLELALYAIHNRL